MGGQRNRQSSRGPTSEIAPPDSFKALMLRCGSRLGDTVRRAGSRRAHREGAGRLRKALKALVKPRIRQKSHACAEAGRLASAGHYPVSLIRSEASPVMLEGATIFALVVAAFVVITALMGVRQVPQGYNYTVERFGRYYKTLAPGLGLIVPYIDSVGRKLNVMEQVMDVPSQEIITKDNATVTVDGVAFYQVLDARRAAYEISDLQSALRNIVMTNVRTVMGSMDLDQLLSHRDEINARLLAVIDAASEPWGIKVTRVEIKDIVPPKDLVDAMGRQMKAEREKRAVILEAEGMRQSDITRAEGRKAALVLEAEGRRDAAFRAAEAVERTAEAEATATRVISEAPANGDVVAVNFLIAEKYIPSLHALAQSPNQKLVIVPMELSSLAGTLGGLSQIAASAMGAEAVAAPRPPVRPRPSGPVVPNAGAPSAPPVSPWQG